MEEKTERTDGLKEEHKERTEGRTDGRSDRQTDGGEDRTQTDEAMGVRWDRGRD